MITATFVKARDRRPGCWPVQGEQRDPGDDRRKRERQVDHAVERALAGKLSRTRTHAITVPATTLIATTISDAITST
jgi:hypothetical protein